MKLGSQETQMDAVNSASPQQVERLMPLVTAFIFAVLVAYSGAWYFGVVEGNVATMLFLASVVTGLFWLGERFYFLPRRKLAAAAVDQLCAMGSGQRDEEGGTTGIGSTSAARSKLLAQPWWLDWTAGLFPVIVLVFLLRAFLYEPFSIPSGSMIPTLQVGDLILVNKFEYGLRLPVLNTKITEGTAPKRGDVMVFRYPLNPRLDYIKRVVGLPGDEVAYLNKRLTINGKALTIKTLPDQFDEDSMRYVKQFEENLGTVKHRILNNDSRPAFAPVVDDFQLKQNCHYSDDGVVCKVPEGHYFMMGDNRDNSLDSRYWGFVPEENIVGKAFFVWMNFGDLTRIGFFH